MVPGLVLVRLLTALVARAFASVTVTVYVPAARPDGSSKVVLLLHAYV